MFKQMHSLNRIILPFKDQKSLDLVQKEGVTSEYPSTYLHIAFCSLKNDGIPNHKSIKISILSFTTSTSRKCITRCLLGLKCNEINNKAAKFGQTIFNPWPTPAASKLRKTEILKFAECCKFTTAADLNFHDLYI